MAFSSTVGKIVDLVRLPAIQFWRFSCGPTTLYREPVSRNFGASLTFLCIAAAGERFAAAKKAEAASMALTGDANAPAFFSWINYPVTGELFLIASAVIYIIAWYPATVVWGIKDDTEQVERTLELAVLFSAMAFFFSFLAQLPFVLRAEFGDAVIGELYKQSRSAHFVSGFVKLAVFAFAVVNIRRLNHFVHRTEFWAGFAAFMLAWLLALAIYGFLVASFIL